MNRREALAAIATAPLVFIDDGNPQEFVGLFASRDSMEAIDWENKKPRRYVVDWIKHTIINGKATTEARIRHKTGWFVSIVEGNEIRLDRDVLLIASPTGFTFQVDGDKPAELLISGWLYCNSEAGA